MEAEAPGMLGSQTGFGIQFHSPIGSDILIKRGIVEPFLNVRK